MLPSIRARFVSVCVSLSLTLFDQMPRLFCLARTGLAHPRLHVRLLGATLAYISANSPQDFRPESSQSPFSCHGLHISEGPHLEDRAARFSWIRLPRNYASNI